jgi:hypothetical protein
MANDLEELKRLADAAIFPKPVNDPAEALKLAFEHACATERFRTTVTPSTILSLIERVVEAEAHVTRLQQAVGGASIAAYQRGMEDAAKVADQAEVSAMLDYGASLADVQKVAVEIAQAIREKAKASAVVWQNPTSWSRESTDGVLYIERVAGPKSPWKAFMAGELIGQGKTEDEAKALCEKAKAGKQGEG